MPEALQTNQSLSKFASVDALAEGYINAEKAIGGRIKIPDKEDDEAWNDLHGKLGRPEKPEEYSFEDIQNAESVGDNQEVLDKFKVWAHEMGLSQRQAAGIADRFLGMNGEMAAAREAQAQQNIDDLKQAFGPSFEERTALANQTLKAMVEKSGANWERMTATLESSGLSTNPDLVMVMSEVGRMMQQDKLWGAGGEPRGMKGMTPRDAKQKIEQIRAEFSKDLVNGTEIGIQKQEEIYSLLDLIGKAS